MKRFIKNFLYIAVVYGIAETITLWRVRNANAETPITFREYLKTMSKDAFRDGYRAGYNIADGKPGATQEFKDLFKNKPFK